MGARAYQYDLQVTHRRGAQNIVPDALSRMFEDEAKVTKISAVDIANRTTDPWYKKMRVSNCKAPKAIS